MTTYSGIHHVALATRDMDQTIRYWRDLLGMRLVAGLGKPGNRQYFFEVAPGAMIAFFEWPEVRPIPEKDHGAPVKGPFGFDHISLCLPGIEDLWELKQVLEDAGFWISETIDHGFILSIYTFDPNGIPLEFSVQTSRVDLHAHPVMLDHSPSSTTLEGPEPVPDVRPVHVQRTELDRTIYPGEGTEFLDPERKNWFGKQTIPEPKTTS